MEFRRQLVLGHSALLLVTLITAAVAAVALRISSARLESVSRDLVADMFAVQRLQLRAEQVVATSRGYLLTGEARSRDHFDGATRAFGEALAEVDRRRGDLGGEVAAIDRAANGYVALARRAAHEREATGDPRDILPFFEQDLAPARDRFEAALTAFADREQAAFDGAASSAHRLAARAQLTVLATTALSIALAIALAVLSSRRLASQYARSRAAAETARRATAARDELVAVVSHDLRNPLATITMGADLLHELDGNPRSRPHVAAIGNAARQMQHLIEQLLDAARLEHGTLELALARCEVGDVLGAAHSLFQVRAVEAGVVLTATAEPGVAVTADRERVVQVLSNLIANALKFTPRGGRIAVTAGRDGPRVRFEVTDTGPGIADDQIARLFERYWKGRSSPRGGLGLGLYICKQLVAAHGGELGVRSRLGEGSTFWFTLPAAGPPSKPT
ncbi:MAG TPA: HAMP domain-containing sensor histidine kinase [Kofleriaceae bacterium]|jgi:signal transduction histidine kinase|nr:HAMP domain-containing sensor histidine kinase [Kofleriaceae bacterium]